MLKKLALGLGVLCGIATGSSLWLNLLLGGQGKESPLCERNCEPPVSAPSWVGYLFVAGLAYVILASAVWSFAEKRKYHPRYAALADSSENMATGVVVGGLVGCIGTPVLLAFSIVGALAYAVVTNW